MVYRLRDALVRNSDYDWEDYDQVELHLDACFLAANVWILLAVKNIWGFCNVNGDGASRNDIVGGKEWTGSQGFFRRAMAVLEAEIGRNRSE